MLAMKNIHYIIGFIIVLLSHSALAADVSLTMRAEKEVPITIQGATIPMLKPVKKISVGDVLVMTLSYKNNETQEAYNVNIDNAIPKGTRFIHGSGKGAGAVFLVSYDNGESYEEDIRIHDTPVTNIRWRFENLAAQAQGEVSFELKVETADNALIR